jgi:hypothetical protein
MLTLTISFVTNPQDKCLILGRRLVEARKNERKEQNRMERGKGKDCKGFLPVREGTCPLSYYRGREISLIKLVPFFNDFIRNNQKV